MQIYDIHIVITVSRGCDSGVSFGLIHAALKVEHGLIFVEAE